MYVLNPDNLQEILDRWSTPDGAVVGTHYCWFYQLTISGPASLAVNAPGTYTLTFKDWQDNALQTNDTVTVHTVDADGKVQDITVNITNGTGTFQFTSAVAGTFTLNAQAQNTVCDVLPQDGLKVVVS